MQPQSRPLWPINLLLVVWSVVAMASTLAHLVLPAWTAAGTVWPSSPHWQYEIAYFDLFGAGLCLWTARQPLPAMKIGVTWLLCALSLLLGLNHLSGWLVAPKIFHVQFTLGNFLVIVWGLAALAYAGAWRPSAR